MGEPHGSAESWSSLSAALTELTDAIRKVQGCVDEKAQAPSVELLALALSPSPASAPPPASPSEELRVSSVGGVVPSAEVSPAAPPRSGDVVGDWGTFSVCQAPEGFCAFRGCQRGILRPEGEWLVARMRKVVTKRPNYGDTASVAKSGKRGTIVEDDGSSNPYQIRYDDGTMSGWLTEGDLTVEDILFRLRIYNDFIESSCACIGTEHWSACARMPWQAPAELPAEPAVGLQVQPPMERVPSLFKLAQQGNGSAQALLDRHCSISSSLHGAGPPVGVCNDVSSLELRCASRLLAREQQLNSEGDDLKVRRLLRREMRQHDAFLVAFDSEGSIGLGQLSANAGPLPVPVWHPRAEPAGLARPLRTKGDYLDELARSCPQGLAAAAAHMSESADAEARWCGSRA